MESINRLRQSQISRVTSAQRSFLMEDVKDNNDVALICFDSSNESIFFCNNL